MKLINNLYRLEGKNVLSSSVLEQSSKNEYGIYYKKNSAFEYEFTAGTGHMKTSDFFINSYNGVAFISWGDGSVNRITDKARSTVQMKKYNHTYSSPGTYRIGIFPSDDIAMIYLYDETISCVVDRTNKIPKNLLALSIYSPNFLWNINEVPIPKTLNELDAYGAQGLTGTITEDTWKDMKQFDFWLNGYPTYGYFSIDSVDNLIWEIGPANKIPEFMTSIVFTTSCNGISGEVSQSTCSSTYLGYFWKIACPQITVDPSIINNFRKTLAPITLKVEAGLSSSAVDSFLQSVWEIKETFSFSVGNPTLDLLGGGNAAPGGVYQAASPPTTGNQYRYDLVNGTYKSAGNEWTVYTA